MILTILWDLQQGGARIKCPWCIVHDKEGDIREHADIEEFTEHKKLVLLDNNILASEHGIKQIEKIAEKNIKVDFNQGLDARLIDEKIVRLLAKLKWIKFIRLACDTQAQMSTIQNAVTLLRWHNVNPANIFVYCLVTENISEAIERIKFLKGLYLDVFAQPYRDFRTNKEPTKEQQRFARWVNFKAIFKSVKWEDYK